VAVAEQYMVLPVQMEVLAGAAVEGKDSQVEPAHKETTAERLTQETQGQLVTVAVAVELVPPELLAGRLETAGMGQRPLLLVLL
jgi:hypothetical protein